jgi:predicted DNA-binding protein
MHRHPPKQTPHICLRHRLTLPVASTLSYSYIRFMPSDQTRVNLTLPPEVVDVLDRLGKVTGAGRATIIREWLIEGQPMFAEMARAAEMAHNKNVDALKVMGDVLRELTDKGDQLQLEMKTKRRAAMRKRDR